MNENKIVGIGGRKKISFRISLGGYIWSPKEVNRRQRRIFGLYFFCVALWLPKFLHEPSFHKNEIVAFKLPQERNRCRRRQQPHVVFLRLALWFPKNDNRSIGLVLVATFNDLAS
ncbi:MAG: hypothetical protein GY772_05590 [bacterium]|nr:hypothetical protein [bacterium]